MVILNGKKFSEKIIKDIKSDIEKNKYTLELHVILIGDNFASEKYVNKKKSVAENIGIKIIIHKFKEDIDTNIIINHIKELNSNINVTGIFVQLPIPDHLNKELIINTIEPLKDVDGFHPTNIGKMFLKDSSALLPCTPYGILKLLDHYNIERKGKKITMIGSSNIVGKPLSLMMINEYATVSTCNHLTPNLKEYTIDADIIIVATGVIKLIKEDMVKDNVVIIDVGINQDPVTKKIVGDVDFEKIKNKASYITPVPGGVGPMTVSMLMKNTLHAYFLQNKKDPYN